MGWREIREYGNSTFELKFTLDIGANISIDSLKNINARYETLALAESHVHGYVNELARAIVCIRERMGDRAGLQFGDIYFPWLPRSLARTYMSAELHLGILSSIFAVREELIGQEISKNFSMSTLPISCFDEFEINPITLSVIEANFTEGTVKSFIEGVLKFPIVALPLVAAAFSIGPIGELYDDHTFQQQINRAVGGQECQSIANWSIDLQSLRLAGIESLNYEASGIPEEQKRMRVCNVQLALKLAQSSPQLIDGIDGEKTQSAFEYFAQKKGRGPDIRDEVLRGELFRAFLGYHH